METRHRRRYLPVPGIVLLALLATLLFLLGQNGSLRAEAPSATPGGLTVVGDLLLFTATDGSYIRELWQIDGTPSGTVRFRETSLGRDLSDETTQVSYVLKLGDKVLYFTSDRQRPQGLWISNGTGEPELMPISSDTLAFAGEWTVVGNLLFFVVVEDFVEDDKRDLWVSDGTEAGTGLVKDIKPGGNDLVQHLVAVGDTLFFTANDGTGSELWKSDGTEAGTVMVKDINPQSTSVPDDLISFNGALYFTAKDGVNGTELWRSDGTEAGTVQVADIQPGAGSSAPTNLTVVGNILFFTADDGVHGREIWKTDGTTTSLVKDIADGDAFSFSGGDLTASGPLLFFVVSDEATGSELWKSDGSAEGTALVADIRPGAEGGLGALQELTAGANGDLFFNADDGVHGRELWRYHAATDSVAMVRDVAPGPADGIPFRGAYQANAGDLILFKDEIFFTADDGATGVELWRSDGTEAGTMLVKDIFYGSEPLLLAAAADGSAPADSADGGPLVYFSAHDTEAGREPWVSDGTISGTRRLADINPGLADSLPSRFVTIGSLTFFAADDGTHGEELWVTDGTPGGTRLVKDIRAGEEGSNLAYNPSTPFQGKLLFAAFDDVNGSELWISDGTEAGTTLLKDIHPGSGSSNVYGLTVLDDVVLFGADDDVNGRELWKTDGTPAGTVLVKDIRPGSRDGNPLSLTRMGDRVYFQAEDGSTGEELWASDGTEAGTVLVKDIVPGSGDARPDSFFATRDTLFFTTNPSEGDPGLWKSDGTEAGTIPLQFVHPDQDYFIVTEAAALTEILIFSYGTPDTGREMWRSDGTEGGTFLLKDINPGPSSSLVARRRVGLTRITYDHLPEAVGDQVYFAAWSPETGAALWKTDGTPEGTVPAVDLVPGAESSTPYPILGTAGDVWFPALDPETGGRELFRHDPVSGETIRLTGPRVEEEESLYLPFVQR